jgi:hypothetical protein
MRVIFESRDANASQLRELAVERVRFALDYSLGRATRVLVRHLQRTHQRPTLQGWQVL